MGTPNDPASPTARPEPSLVSIVVPVYNEAENIGPLAKAIAEALGAQKYELILVDDGSTDDSFRRIGDLAASDPRIVGLSLARNFGKQCALSGGLSFARGDVIITMDGDLEHPPALVPELIAKWRKGYNVVQTLRLDPDDTPFLKRLCSRAFHGVFSAITGIRMEPGACDYGLIDRVVLAELLRIHEGDLFLRGLLAWMGYRGTTVPFRRGTRLTGRSKYPLPNLLRVARSALFSFSTVPLRIGIIVGLVTALASIAELVYVLIVRLAGRPVPGWTSTMVVLTVLMSVLFILLGVQGEYILRIYERVQRRPSFLVERIVAQTARKPGGRTPPA
ncbi:MAG: glycosyltransferase family 2 protein [Planctomycetota bacterium]